MQQLPIKQLHCQGQIVGRYMRVLSSAEPLILTIPGGPCLSSQYLDNFLIKLSSALKVNVGVIDLPNHGDSNIASENFPLTYPKCLNLLKQLLIEFANQHIKLILFGQSLGARLAFDLIAQTDIQIGGSFLTGLPYQFQMSDGLLKKIKNVDLGQSEKNDNQVRAWKKILPFYTYAPLAKEISVLLVSDMKFSGNEHLLDDVPSIETSAEAVLKKYSMPPIMIVQGDKDGVVPDNNLLKLKKIIPSASFVELQNCGHFPMLENPEKTLEEFSKFMLKVV